MKILGLLGMGVLALDLSAQAPTPPPPSNSAPNPYTTIDGWGKMPAGRVWGSTSAVDVAKDGKHIWVAERCGTNSCAGSALDPVLQFDEDGKLVRSFGAGLVLSPHGITVDREGNVWVTDCACTGTADQRATKSASGAPMGHQVFKFSPEGRLLLTLGTPGGSREPESLYQPNDVLIAPNGEVFVAEGHSSSAAANARIVVFDSKGTFLRSFGAKGTGPGEFDQPHALAMDSKGRLYVGDRTNNRIQIMDQQGKLLDTWYQFSRPSGIWIDRHDNIFVTDSESGSVAPARGEWKRGIRIGNVRDGKVTAFIPDPAENATNTSAAEGVAVDGRGNIYGAEVGPRTLRRYVKR